MKSLTLCMFLLLIGTTIAFATDPSAKPNVLILLADDLGWADLACYGSKFHESPNLDRLATQGMKFSVAYSAASLCSPTRASIMTGKHPARVNITDWIPGAGDKGRKLKTPQDIHNLPLSEYTIGEALKDSGYETYYIGKWHLGDPQHGPDKQGFDIYTPTAKRSVDASGKSKMTRVAVPEGDRWHLTRYITEHASNFISKQKQDRPFFAFVSYHDVHTPIHADSKFVNDFQLKAKSFGKTPLPIQEGSGKTRMAQDNPKYASMVRALDESIGEILDTLNKSGLEENTIVLFASDNGGLSTKRKPGPCCNLPLRAGKGWLYEGGIRIPLMVRYPGKVKAETVSKMPVTTTDFYPTILDLTKLKSRPEQHLDGVSFANELLGQPSERTPRDLFWHFPHYHGSCWTPGAAINSGHWKLITFYETGRSELYDMRSDPFEKNDLAKSRPGKVRDLEAKLLAWQKELNAQLPEMR